MLICSTLHIIDKVVIILTHHYGYLLKVLSGCMKASMDNALASMDLTSAQGHIMGYLAQRSQPPCSRDIEETFHMSHPTVSGAAVPAGKRRTSSSFGRTKPTAAASAFTLLPKGKRA